MEKKQIIKEHMSALGKKGAKARWKNVSKKERSAHARMMSLSRKKRLA